MKKSIKNLYILCYFCNQNWFLQVLTYISVYLWVQEQSNNTKYVIRTTLKGMSELCIPHVWKPSHMSQELWLPSLLICKPGILCYPYHIYFFYLSSRKFRTELYCGCKSNDFHWIYSNNLDKFKSFNLYYAITS